PPGRGSNRSTARAVPPVVQTSPFMFANLDDSERRHGDANAARELKHYEFVLRNGGKPGRGKLHNPGPAHAVGRNTQAAGSFHDGGKLQLYAGQRKAHRGTVLMIAAGGGVAIMRMALKRADDKRAGKVGAQDGQQKKPTIG